MSDARIESDELPDELDRAFTALCRSFADFWPHVVERIKAQSPETHADMLEYMRLGGVIRAVVHDQPGPAVSFELIEHDGTPREFYRVRGSRRAGRGLQ
jgi:hypothetical protein